VPGGRIFKDERISDAFARVLKAETNYDNTIDQAQFRGVYEHFYEVNRFGAPGYGTHYVVLAYEIEVGISAQLELDAQHSEYVWWSEPTILASNKAHENTKAYFR
jgi:colanic acid biosynthesis protein WcaH